MTKSKTEVAIFAAGCFWGVQYYFDQVPGVLETEAGYTGGHRDNPTYEQVCRGATGHVEAVKIIFDPTKVNYEILVKQFFRMHDPTQLNRQGPDVGDQYRSAIFYMDETQRITAEQIRDNIVQPNSKKKIVTTLERAGKFWPAEDYHQKYTERTVMGMCHVPYQSIN